MSHWCVCVCVYARAEENTLVWLFGHVSRNWGKLCSLPSAGLMNVPFKLVNLTWKTKNLFSSLYLPHSCILSEPPDKWQMWVEISLVRKGWWAVGLCIGGWWVRKREFHFPAQFRGRCLGAHLHHPLGLWAGCVCTPVLGYPYWKPQHTHCWCRFTGYNSICLVSTYSSFRNKANPSPRHLL